MGVMEARRRILLNQPHLIDASGNPISFSTDMAAKMGVKAYFSPVQEGTGDPSPQNVRPISGWQGCNVTRCGKNLFNASATPTMTNVFQNNGNPVERRGYIFSLPVGTYTVSASRVVQNDCYIYFNVINADGTLASFEYFSGGAGPIYPITKTLTSGQYIVIYDAQAISTDANTRFNYLNIQLELGSTATAYEPYSGSSYPVTFLSEAGTLYGGYVDYERGEVVAEWGYIASYNGETIPGEWMSDRDVYAAGTSPTTGAEVVYELATPIHYPLTPTLIKSLKGANTIWSDMNGNLEISYWKH